MSARIGALGTSRKVRSRSPERVALLRPEWHALQRPQRLALLRSPARLYWPPAAIMSSRSDSQRAAAVIKAPLSGPLVPLIDVPDPVFAQKIVGDGISIDPITSQLLAPCDGKVVQLHRAGHAVTIATADGIDVLMHI